MPAKNKQGKVMLEVVTVVLAFFLPRTPTKQHFLAMAERVAVLAAESDAQGVSPRSAESVRAARKAAGVPGAEDLALCSICQDGDWEDDDKM